jgi:transposase-like protein
MVSKQSPRSYSEEFKKDAIRLLETSGKSKAEISRELGIPNGLLGRWQRRFQVNTDSERHAGIERHRTAEKRTA